MRLAYTLSAGTRDLLAGTRLRIEGSRLMLLLREDSGVFAGESVIRRLERLAQVMGLQAASADDLVQAAAMIRRAIASEADAVRDLVRAAYQHYVPIIGIEPAPMTDDYAKRIADEQVWVLVADADAGRRAGAGGTGRLFPAR